MVFILFIWNKASKLLSKKKKLITIEKIVKHFPFTEENSLKEWEEKILKGKVVYKIEKDDTIESYVRAKSERTASALYYKTKLHIRKNPIISWKWHVDEFPKRTLPEQIDLKKEEDFAARIYVIFPAVFFTNSKVIEYIWAEQLPVGTSGISAYSKNIKILVLRSGKYNEKWLFEKRDVYQDYVKLFGEEPRLNIGAIAFMTDADSTKTKASAVYDEIKIGYKE
ncbi:MAG: DUF3047 domain-containing protein [Candidatus Omnitrophica bacterium]|nr:DUF3047 domain-containing protein [Candidatus Omnitrophota bacterium]